MATPASYDINVKEQTGRELVRNGVKYSMADQVARFANAKATNDAPVSYTHLTLPTKA